MEELKKLQEEYKKLRTFGHNQIDAAERSVAQVFKDSSLKPYIYKDENGDASHIFLEKHALFFEGGIYSKV